MSDEHGEDIRKSVARLKEKFGLPVWLVGTSRGSTSVANGALSVGPRDISGIVLTSSVGIANRHGGNILDFNLKQITVPVLVAHHERDGCSVTPIEGAIAIQKEMTGSRRTDFLSFDGGGQSRNPCGASSPHGFRGLEKDVVEAIAASMVLFTTVV